MITNRWWIAAAALAVATLACSKKYSPQPISKEAADAFGHLETTGMGGSLVVDGEALRELGFGVTPEQQRSGDAMLEFAANLLPTLAGEMQDEPQGPVLARTAVLLALVREWGIAPHAQRLGIAVQVNPASPEDSVHRSIVLLAVKESESDNRELLQGLGAAVRAASGKDLVRTEKGDLCAAPDALPEVPFQVCLRPGPGYLALGTAEGLAALASPPTAPAKRESGPLLRLSVNVPMQGRGELTIEGHGSLRVAGVFEPEDAKLAGEAEQALQKALEALDEQRTKTRTVMASALGEVQTAIAEDPEAPGRMKSAVKSASVDRLLDPRGEYAVVRKSIKIERKDRKVTAELTIPEAQVRRFAQLDASVMTTAATIGVLSAIAIPNFVKYQCRSKTSEGRVVLEAARKAMDVYRGQHNAVAPSLRAAGYAPAPGRYAVCTRAGCVPETPEAEACEAALGTVDPDDAGALCAVAEIDGVEDVWVLQPGGAPESFRSACR